MKLHSVFFNLLFAAVQVVSAQDLQYAQPLQDVYTLAGTYAELRPNHFHGGWDFRTHGQENKPVYAVAKGYVARVVISPTGYGKMAMINHPDGTTTIYGHLNGFVGRLDSAVKAEQYKQRRFEVVAEFRPDEFPVVPGQQFAISGNTGGSAGPHLHFEIRRTSDLLMLNPFLHNDIFGIVDTKKPTIYGVKIYGATEAGAVDGKAEKKYLCNAGKNTTLRHGQIIPAWGKITFAVKASDAMDGTYFNYGVRKLWLDAEGKNISEIHIDSFPFEQKRAVNSLIDFAQRAVSREYYVKFSKEPGNPLQQHVATVNNAVLCIDTEGKEYPVTIRVQDDFGNADTFSFVIKGKPMPLPAADTAVTKMLRQGQDNIFSNEHLLLHFSKDALYTDVPLHYSTDTTARNYLSPVHEFGTDLVPIHTEVDYAVKVEQDTLQNKRQYVLARVNKRNMVTGVVQKARYFNGYMAGTTNYLSRLAVFQDKDAPTIKPLNITKLKANPVLSFRIRDNLAGIKSYDGYIDGEWHPFEFDAKTARLHMDLRRTGIEKGTTHTVKIVVTDGCENTATHEVQIYY